MEKRLLIWGYGLLFYATFVYGMALYIAPAPCVPTHLVCLTLAVLAGYCLGSAS